MVKNVAVLRMAMTKLSGPSDPLPGVASPRCRAKVPSGRWLGRAVLGRAVLGRAVLGRADGWAGLVVGSGSSCGRTGGAAEAVVHPSRWPFGRSGPGRVQSSARWLAASGGPRRRGSDGGRAGTDFMALGGAKRRHQRQ